MNLAEKLELVSDQESFLSFVEALLKDRCKEVELEKSQPSSPYGPGPLGWENHTIEDYLESALAWAKASEFGETQGIRADDSWKKIAVFLYCGKIYE